MCSHGTACRFRAISRAGRRRALVFSSLSPGHSPAVSTPFTVARGRAQTVRVAGGGPKTVDWPADADGCYAVTVTANSGDGFARRYAGRIA
jgi:Domain of unknown function (DUF756)